MTRTRTHAPVKKRLFPQHKIMTDHPIAKNLKPVLQFLRSFIRKKKGFNSLVGILPDPLVMRFTCLSESQLDMLVSEGYSNELRRESMSQTVIGCFQYG